MLTASDVRDSFKYLFPKELPALQSLVRSLPPDPFVVNIGAGAGTSGLAILESRPDVILLTIDVQDLSSPFGCLEGERDVVQRAGMGNLWGVRWFQICDDSAEVGKEWLDGVNLSFKGRIFSANDFVTSNLRWGRRPQMVFVDGNHSYEHARADIEIWMQCLDDKGILVVHDFSKDLIPPDPNGPHPKPWPGVDRAVNELLIGKYVFALHVDSLIAFYKEPVQDGKVD